MNPENISYRLIPFSEFDMSDWENVFQASKTNNLFYHSSFIAAAQQVWPTRQPHGVATAWSGDQLVAFQPYREKKNYLGKVVSLLSLPTSDRNTPILLPNSDGVVASNLINCLVQESKPDLLVAQSIQHEIQELLCQKYSEFDVRIENEQIGYISYLPKSIEDFWEQFNSKSRNQLKRKIRKSHDSGLRFRVISAHQMPDGYSLVKALDTLTILHKMRFKSLKKDSFFIEKDYQEFYRILSASDNSSRGLRLTFTEALFKGQVVGSMFGVSSDTHYIYLSIGFDPQYAPLSPGNVMIYYTLENLIKNGINTLDYKCGDEPYKRKWTKDFYVKHDLKIIFTSSGRLIFYYRYALDLIKKIKKIPAKIQKIFNI